MIGIWFQDDIERILREHRYVVVTDANGEGDFLLKYQRRGEYPWIAPYGIAKNHFFSKIYLFCSTAYRIIKKGTYHLWQIPFIKKPGKTKAAASSPKPGMLSDCTDWQPPARTAG